MAWLSDDEQQALLRDLDLESFTGNTIIDREKIREHLKTIRERGWALDDQENEAHIRCVSAPVKGIGDRVGAAISISGLAQQLDGEYLLKLSVLVQEACARLSRALGGG